MWRRSYDSCPRLQLGHATPKKGAPQSIGLLLSRDLFSSDSLRGIGGSTFFFPPPSPASASSTPLTKAVDSSVENLRESSIASLTATRGGVPPNLISYTASRSTLR